MICPTDSLLTAGADGLTGSTLPYTLGGDTVSTIGLLILLTSALLVGTAARARLQRAFRRFLGMPLRKDDPSGSEQRRPYRLLLIIPLSYLVALALLPLLEPGLCTRNEPITIHLWLASVTLLLSCAYSLKCVLYRCINALFFPSERAQHWSEIYFLTLLPCALVLPLILLQYSLPLKPEALGTALAAAYLVGKGALWYKAKGTFFAGSGGHVHNILYFCALEIAPFIGLYQLFLLVSALVARDPILLS